MVINWIPGLHNQSAPVLHQNVLGICESQLPGSAKHPLASGNTTACTWQKATKHSQHLLASQVVVLRVPGQGAQLPGRLRPTSVQAASWGSLCSQLLSDSLASATTTSAVAFKSQRSLQLWGRRLSGTGDLFMAESFHSSESLITSLWDPVTEIRLPRLLAATKVTKRSTCLADKAGSRWAGPAPTKSKVPRRPARRRFVPKTRAISPKFTPESSLGSSPCGLLCTAKNCSETPAANQPCCSRGCEQDWTLDHLATEPGKKARDLPAPSDACRYGPSTWWQAYLGKEALVLEPKSQSNVLELEAFDSRQSATCLCAESLNRKYPPADYHFEVRTARVFTRSALSPFGRGRLSLLISLARFSWLLPSTSSDAAR